MDTNELVLTVGRATAVYVLMLVVVRALGKRTVGNFRAFDLLVALMLSEIADEVMYVVDTWERVEGPRKTDAHPLRSVG